MSAAAKRTDDGSNDGNKDAGKIIRLFVDRQDSFQIAVEKIAQWLESIKTQLRLASDEMLLKMKPEQSQIAQAYTETLTAQQSIKQATNDLNQLKMPGSSRLMEVWTQLESKDKGILELTQTLCTDLLSLAYAEILKEKHAKIVQNIRYNYQELDQRMDRLIRSIRELGRSAN